MKRFKSVQATGSPQVIRLENKVSRDDVERVDHATRKIIFREAGATHKAWCSGDDMCGASLHRGMNYSLSPALCTPDTDTALPCPPRRPSVGDTVIYNVPHAPPSLLSLLFFFFSFSRQETSDVLTLLKAKSNIRGITKIVEICKTNVIYISFAI